jgi:Kdo2-lipid IVA lauroyltransferase/acyltransferase
VRFRIEELLVRLISAIVRVLPMSTVRSAGHAIGRLAYYVDRFHRRIALDNMANAFPSRSRQELEGVVKATFAHFGAVLLELLKFGTLSEREMVELVDVEGTDRVNQAYQHGHGVLLFTGHFGYWEVQGLMQPLHARPVSVLARPLDNPHLHDMLERIRTRTGNSVIYRQRAIRKVLRELALNHGVAMLIDQHLHTPDAVYVDFFRRPAATTNALAALAIRTGSPVIPAFAMPISGGRYRLVYEHPVDPPRDDTPEAIHDFTQRCTDVLEMYVRRHPEQWLWMHRRWRERPLSPVSEVAVREAGVDL